MRIETDLSTPTLLDAMGAMSDHQRRMCLAALIGLDRDAFASAVAFLMEMEADDSRYAAKVAAK